MPSKIVSSILKKSTDVELFSLLVDKLSGTELNSLLLEVFTERAAKISAPELFNLYRKNRFVKPADLPVLDLKEMELDLLKFFEKNSFQLLDLSPVSVLGSCSVVATADQNKILSALRGTEVLADATNAIALHVCELKKQNSEASFAKFNFATVQRHLRTQSISGKGFTPHFRIGCLVTCGRDTGNFDFEKQSLLHHMGSMYSLYKDYYKVDDVRFRFLCRGGYRQSLELNKRVQEFVQKENSAIKIDIVANPEKENNYYKGIQYKIDIVVKGKTYEIGDGGFVDWTQQLLQNRKERMLSTGIGFDFMYRILKNLI